MVVQGKSFFQKQAPAPARVGEDRHAPQRAQTIDYLLAQTASTVVWLANLAALELHTPARAR